MPPRHLSPLKIALLLGVALAAVRLTGCTVLERIDARAVDYRLQRRGIEAASEQVVVVAVDDRSLREVGRWPWPRTVVARLLDEISGQSPAVIGFDIVQSESVGERILKGLPESLDGVDEESWRKVKGFLGELDEGDRLLAEAVERSRRTVLGYFFDFDNSEPNHDTVVVGRFDGLRPSDSGRGESRIIRPSHATVNLPALTRAARSTGYFNVLPDPWDGSHRRIPMAARFGDSVAVPLSLAMIQLYRPNEPVTIRFADFGVESLTIGRQRIPVAEDGQLLLNYRGPGRTIRHVSAVDLLRGDIEPDTFTDKLVVVGVSATAVGDVRTTPFDGVFPGVEVHATALDNILRDDFIYAPEWLVLVEVAQILLAALVLGCLMRIASGVHAAAVAAALIVAHVTVGQYLFESTGITLGMAYPVVSIALIYIGASLHQFSAERREKRRIREAFGRFMSPELARLVSKDPEAASLGGSRRELTVLFSDIRGFTEIAERMEPERLVEVLNTYLGEMTDVVFERRGTLDKHIGDAIMALWGAPLPDQHHADLACHAACDMIRRLEELRPTWRERGYPEISIGVGIHTGEAVAGNMGSERRLSYTAIGDCVNLTARLEGLTRFYGVPILVSEETLSATASAFDARELDLVRVKGKHTAVRVFELLVAVDEASRETLVERFAEGLALYRSRNWKEAACAFDAVRRAHPGDRPSEIYLERCLSNIEAEPAQDWIAVTVMDAK